MSSSPFTYSAGTKTTFLDAAPGFTGSCGTFTLTGSSSQKIDTTRSGGSIQITGGSGMANNAQGGNLTVRGAPSNLTFGSTQHASQTEVDQLRRDMEDLKGMVRALVATNERLEEEIEALKDGALLE